MNAKESLPNDPIKRLEDVSTDSVFSALWDLGYKNNCMRDIVPITIKDAHVVGHAVTIRYLTLKRPMDPEEYRKTASFRVVEAAKKGDVLVMGGLGYRIGLIGDVMASGFKVRGVSAVVIDGGVRDVPLIKEMEFPVFARFATPAHIEDRLVAVEFNSPIDCDGVQVNPGDIIVADEDGVVAIPIEVADKVAELGWKHERLDEESRKRILAGVPLGEAYPPREEWLKKG